MAMIMVANNNLPLFPLWPSAGNMSVLHLLLLAVQQSKYHPSNRLKDRRLLTIFFLLYTLVHITHIIFLMKMKPFFS